MIYTLVVKSGENIDKILTLDSVTGFNKTMSGTVSKNPVENGFPISDHVSLDNLKFDISGIITSYSILSDDLELRWNGQYFETVGGNTDRLSFLESDIEDTFKRREVVTLIESDVFIPQGTTSLDEVRNSISREYDNVVITNISIDSQAGVNGAKFVRITAEQLQIAFLEKSELTPEEQTPRLVGTKARVATGTSSATTTNTDQSLEVPSAKAADDSEVKKLIGQTDGNKFDTIHNINQKRIDNLNAVLEAQSAAQVEMNQNGDAVFHTVYRENGNVEIWKELPK